MTTPPITLDATAVEVLLPQVDVLQEMRQLFIGLGNAQAVQPPQTLALLSEDKGDFITYLGADTNAGVFGAKLSPYLLTSGKPIITAWTVLMSAQTGQPLCLCDAGALTTERTAATTALAIDLLAHQDAKRIAIIGSGPVAAAHWRHVQKLRPWQQVHVSSPNLKKDSDNWAHWQSVCPNVILADSAEAAAQDADVVMLCTSSGSPVVDHTKLSSNALVTSISTNAHQAHEVSPAFLTHAQVYCDYRATTPATAGEMVLAARDHGWTVADLRGDLAELSVGTCPIPAEGRPVFFRSVGLGLEDIAIAHAIYRAACAQK
ncbi:ornithine cyclodeaminase [Sulfitobacter sp. SK012]|uniref:ornithine cyclodeaminase family protein n=1 Tax=Sulfitobacter sp. SK012 TaxID=1389005 RepID=UPI000E0B0B41|nr:ornithine cyclodeaminase family protein [Sulfitobacter sp. SK012]AXI46273.1 ornithine cyclodeaminase [Sulfitobacter sp. SK012]